MRQTSKRTSCIDYYEMSCEIVAPKSQVKRESNAINWTMRNHDDPGSVRKK